MWDTLESKSQSSQNEHKMILDCMVTIQEIVVDGLDAAKHAFVK